jgi:hypothetical protein
MGNPNDIWDDYGWELADLDQGFTRVCFEAVKASTELAMLITVDGMDHWIPRSQIECLDKRSESKFDTSGTMRIPDWLAEAHGL